MVRARRHPPSRWRPMDSRHLVDPGPLPQVRSSPALVRFSKIRGAELVSALHAACTIIWHLLHGQHPALRPGYYQSHDDTKQRERRHPARCPTVSAAARHAELARAFKNTSSHSKRSSTKRNAIFRDGDTASCTLPRAGQDRRSRSKEVSRPRHVEGYVLAKVPEGSQRPVRGSVSRGAWSANAPRDKEGHKRIGASSPCETRTRAGLAELTRGSPPGEGERPCLRRAALKFGLGNQSSGPSNRVTASAKRQLQPTRRPVCVM